MMPTGYDVAAFLGQRENMSTVVLAEEHLPVVVAFVHAYTRGQGFTDGEPGNDLRHVIVSACARLTDNPQLAREESIGDFSITRTVFNGWTLPELAVLHRYRRRVA